jgi:hypothetical protein
MRELGEALARWLVARGVSEDATGTSLKRAWFKEAEEPSPAPAAAAEPQAIADPVPALEPPIVPEPSIVEVQSPEPPLFERSALDSSPRISEPEVALTALAELHRGGEPEERFRRAARRRSAMTFVLLVTLVFGATFAILVGTGIVQI